MTSYHLPPNYTERLDPAYFADVLPEADLWQRDVYLLAARLARQAGVKRIVDIGCGRAGKLMKLAREFEITGFDYGTNIDQCNIKHPGQLWIGSDLGREVLHRTFFEDSVTLCSDVIEHIPDLTALLETLRNASKTAAYVLVSTPARERMYKQPHYGKPDNPAHVREWTLDEFTGWLESEGLPIVWKGYTVSYAKQQDKRNTILVILSNTETVEDMPLAFEEVK